MPTMRVAVVRAHINFFLQVLRGCLGASAASRISRCHFRGLGSDMHFSFQFASAGRGVSSFIASMTARNMTDPSIVF